MLAQDKNLSTNFCHDLAFVLQSAVLQNMLNDVVTVLILQEGAEMYVAVFFYYSILYLKLFSKRNMPFNLTDKHAVFFSSSQLVRHSCISKVTGQ